MEEYGIGEFPKAATTEAWQQFYRLWQHCTRQHPTVKYHCLSVEGEGEGEGESEGQSKISRCYMVSFFMITCIAYSHHGPVKEIGLYQVWLLCSLNTLYFLDSNSAFENI